jgi:hypothetical protein
MLEEETQNQNKIFIDDKEYDLATFDKEQIKCIQQLKDLEVQEAALVMRFDQLVAAKSVFTNTLKSSLEK